MATDAFIPLMSTTLTATASQVNIIPPTSGYKDLRLVVQGSTNIEGNISLRFNSVTSTLYYSGYITGYSTSSQTTGVAYRSSVVANLFTGLTANEQALNTYDILDYASTTFPKIVLGRVNQTTETSINGFRFESTSPITLIEVSANFSSAVFNVGTVISIYGIKA